MLSTQLLFMVLQADGRLSQSTATFRGCNSSTTPTCTHRLPPLLQTKRDILALPSRLGGLGILNPSANSQLSFHASVTLTIPLITAQNLNGTVTLDLILEAKKNIRNSNHLREVCLASELNSVLSTDQKKKIALAKE